MFKKTVQKWTSFRLLRRLVSTQTEIQAELGQISAILDQMGHILAQNSQKLWISPKKAEKGQKSGQNAENGPEMADLDTLTGLGAPSDEFFAEIEALKDEYEARFGRILSDEEVLEIHQERQDQLKIEAQ